MASQIQIIEKPDWVSWEDIKQCLYDAHSVNRSVGVNMVKYQWPIEKIKQSIGENGVILVALDGQRVIGTSAVGEKFGTVWYKRGRYAYMSLSCVLPEYSGQGIFKRFEKNREEIARLKGLDVFVTDTHESNKRRRQIAEVNGYRLVDYFRVGDHYNVALAKWPKGCPYSKIYCQFRYYLSWTYAHIRTFLSKGYHTIHK